jgi:uncharacterized protein (DUF1800 family)
MTCLKPLVGAVALLMVVSRGPGALVAQGSDTASALLEAAIQKQLVDGDVVAAIAQYESILLKFGDQRRVAAQALWRLAGSQEQVGRLDQARRSYERLLREHGDNPALVSAAQARLVSLVEDSEWTDPELGREVIVTEDWRPTSTTPDFGCCAQFSVFSDLSIHYRGSGESRRLQTTARSAAYPVLSPNRQQVAFLSWDGDLKENEQRRLAGSAPLRNGVELRVVSVDGTEDRVVLRGSGLRWLRPYGWSPDGRTVLTLVERTSGVRQVALVRVADGSLSILKSLPWLSAREMSFSEDGQFVAYQGSAPANSTQFEFFILPVAAGASPLPEHRYSLSVAGQRGGRVPETELVVHVLNRVGFGPRRGDVDRVRAMGVDAYIEQQLHPERIADPIVDAKIGGFTSLRMDIPELLEKAGPAVAIASRRRATIFERPGLVARAQAAGPAGAPGMGAGGPPMGLDARPRDLEAHGARMIRAVHSERQLQEVLVDFWMNHFNVMLQDDQLTPHFEEQVIRRHTFGRFEDLLKAVARHPEMLAYLDNWRSSAPAEVIEKRLTALKQAADVDGRVALLQREAFLKESKGLNENFARELLELHTMGVDSGYTQQDIVAVAQILTGWTIQSTGLVNAREEDGVFAFDPLMHVEGDKVVLGQTFRSGGVEEGEALLTMLAHRPETARFISTKLVRRFIADEPPPAVVEAASRTFLNTKGDIRAVVRTILMSPEFRSSETLRVKVKKPFELVASALRAVDATFETPDVYASLVASNRSYIARMGEKMYNHEAPDGNPDVGPAWMNSNALLVRLDFANQLATGKLPGVTGNLTVAETLLAEMGVPRPTPAQIEQTRVLLAAAAAGGIDGAAMGGQMTMRMAGPATGASGQAPADPQAIAVAAMLGSPQFQKR